MIGDLVSDKCGPGAGPGSGAGAECFRAIFQALPTPCAVLDRDLVLRECNEAYLGVTGRSRESLLGRHLLDAFPDRDPAGEAGTNVLRVLEQAVRTRHPAILGAQRYDISSSDDPAAAEVKLWTTTAVPLLDATGEVTSLLYNIHDVTALTEDPERALPPEESRILDLFRAAVEVSEQARLFDDTVVAERQLGLAVQDAMLPTHVPDELQDRVVVRYRPASQALHVGGDWYDVTCLDDDRFTVAVGDVVGHGLTAAVTMGQLRSALTALTLADLDPAAALTGLDRFARQDESATLSTAVKVIIDERARTLTYSSAGHLLPLLMGPEGKVRRLDQAQGPALALTEKAGPRPLATTTYAPGDRLVLYTDGLVERRGEDIDAGLDRLTDLLLAGRDRPLNELADTLLAGQEPGHSDDVALVIVQL